MSSVLFSCAICMNQWPDSHALRSLKCGHTFCDPCIQRHININRDCPSCRAAPVKPRHIRPVYVEVDASDPTIGENARTIANFEAEINRMTAELERLRLENNGLRRDDSYSTSRIKELEAIIKERNRTIGELKHARDDLKKEKRRLTRAGAQLGDDLTATRAQLGRTEEDLKRSRAQLSRTEEDLSRSRDELHRANAEEASRRSREEALRRSHEEALKRLREEALRRSREEALRRSREERHTHALHVTLCAASDMMAHSAQITESLGLQPAHRWNPPVARSVGKSRTQQRRATTSDWM